jgi:hypothetical protein
MLAMAPGVVEMPLGPMWIGASLLNQSGARTDFLGRFVTGMDPGTTAVRQGLFSSSRNGVALMFGDDSHDPDRHAVGIGHVSRHEINAGIAEVEQESRIARKSIDLRNQQGCPMQAACCKSPGSAAPNTRVDRNRFRHCRTI